MPRLGRRPVRREPRTYRRSISRMFRASLDGWTAMCTRQYTFALAFNHHSTERGHAQTLLIASRPPLLHSLLNFLAAFAFLI